jgi:phospholipase C
MQFRAFATEPGTSVTDSWRLTDFADGRYLVRVDGPNGFMRSFWGEASGPRVDVRVAYALGSQGGPNGELHVALRNPTNQDLSVTISDEAYGMSSVHRKLPAGGSLSMTLATAEGWYDWSVRIDGDDRFERRIAGHVETGQASTSDPAMGSAKRR